MDQVKERRKRELYSVLLMLILIGITVGYAALSTNLNINGTSRVSGNSWDIHFANLVVTSGSVTITSPDQAATINQSDTTKVTYIVTLNKPGDFYEFTVDAVNSGTVEGMIDSVTSKLNNVVIDSEHPLPAYLDYSVTYADGRSLYPKQKLVAGESETYKVRVEFKQDIENSQLPSTDQSNTFSFEVAYVQKDNTAQDRLTFLRAGECLEDPPITTTTEPYSLDDGYLIIENGNGTIVNRIVKIKINGSFIELIGGDGGLAYLRNKETITNACPEQYLRIESGGTACNKPGERFNASTSGKVSFYGDAKDAIIYENGTYSISSDEDCLN